MLTFAPSAHAVPIVLHCVTFNLAGDCAIADAQIVGDLFDPGGGQVAFSFSNLGPEQSTLARIYFEDSSFDQDGSLAALSTIVQDPNLTDFIPAPFPGPYDPPGGNNADPPFSTTEGLLAGASSPAPSNGVGPGEMVTLIFDLRPGRTVDDVIGEFNAGALRAGAHVINFASGGSEGMVSMPEPSAALLLAGGLAGMAALRRRRRRGLRMR